MRHTLILLLLIVANSTFAHVDKTYTFQYDKTFISIETGFYCEEVEKIKIIGKLISKLANKYGYEDKIIIDFTHNYGLSTEKQIFLNYGVPDYKYSDEFGDYIDSVKHKGNFILLREYNTTFNIEQTIKLIEFAITNTKYIKNNSSYINSKPYSCESISKDKIQSIIRGDIQETGRVVISQKIYKEEAAPPKVSYFSKNGKFILFKRETNGIETSIDTLHSIHRIISTAYYCFAFTDWDEFYYYNRRSNYTSSVDSFKIRFEDKTMPLTAIKIEELNDNTFLIYHSMPLWNEPINIALFNGNQGIKIDNLLDKNK